MTDPGTIAALVGLGSQLSNSCDGIIKSLKTLPTKRTRVPQLDVISAYCSILQVAINQICNWTAAKLPKSSIPTSSVIAVQAATADLLEFIQLLHNELQTAIRTDAAEQSYNASRRPAASESTLRTLSEQIQMLAGSLQLMVAATMM